MGKTLLNSKKKYKIFDKLPMPIKLFFFKLGVIFEMLVILNIWRSYCYDKVSLNAASYKTAGSISSVHISKESKLKDIKIISL